MRIIQEDTHILKVKFKPVCCFNTYIFIIHGVSPIRQNFCQGFSEYRIKRVKSPLNTKFAKYK